MNVLQQHLDDLGPTTSIKRLAMELSQHSAIESDRQGPYVSLRPSMEGAVAVYLHRTWISIALAPERALEIISQFPGATLDKKTPATTYVHLADTVLTEYFATALQVAGEAVLWRSTGPLSNVGTSSAKKGSKPLGSCPVHHYELLPSGACPECAQG